MLGIRGIKQNSPKPSRLQSPSLYRSIYSKTRHTQSVRVRMSSSTPGHHRSLCLNNEYRNLREDLFKEMPQNPHYKLLDKYCVSVGDSIKVGLDVVFINLAQKFARLTSSVELLSDVEEFIAELSELDEMGYDCTKLWERFDTLRALSELEQADSLKLEEITSKRRDKEVKATLTHTRITELEAELKRLKDASKTQQEEIETLNVTKRNYTREEEKIFQDFRSAATAPW